MKRLCDTRVPQMFVVLSFYVCTLFDSGMEGCLEVGMNTCWIVWAL